MKLYSILIPVYNSASIVKETIKQTVQALKESNIQFEIILVNDGSTDKSWEVLRTLTTEFSGVRAINLIRNYGQHTAVLCAIAHAKGDFLVTMDDDLQNPPGEIIKLIEKSNEGFDLVFAKFYDKKHKSYRRLGSKLVGYLNKKIFLKPDHITLSNFRIFSKEVGERITSYRTNYPYIPGLLLLHAGSIANVYTDHHERLEGKSNYNIFKILSLVSRLLFNYSSYPLKVLTGLGIISALVSFGFGMVVFLRAFLSDSATPGWASLMIMLSFLNGLAIIMIGILGIYVSRTLVQVSLPSPYHIKEIID